MNNDPIKIAEHTHLKVRKDGSIWLAKFENHSGLQAMTLTKEELTEILKHKENEARDWHWFIET